MIICKCTVSSDGKGDSRKLKQAHNHMAANQMAASEKNFHFFFRLRKSFTFFKLTIPVVYYKRNLYAYNFGCQDFNKNISHTFVWSETEGPRGPEEISSCLIKYTKTYAENFEKIILYSDSCITQNFTEI